MKKTHIFCFILLALLVFSTFSSTTCAFDKDTHYYLKYYLLRRVGFCKEQASIIAKADVSIDSGKTDAGFYNKNNEKWHAMATEEENDARQEALWNRAQDAYSDDTKSLEKRLAPFGQFLHFLEDRTTHEDYGWRLGHGADGHIPDYLSSYSLDTLKQAINVWLGYMKMFLQIKGWGEGLESNPVTADDVEYILRQLINANPENQFWNFYLRPDFSKAKDIINDALKNDIDSTDHVDSPLYEFDEDGEIVGTLPMEQFSISTVQQTCNTLFIQDAITVISSSPFFSSYPEASDAIQWLNNFTEEQKVIAPSINSLCYAITNLTELAQNDENIFNETKNLSLLMLDCVFKRDANVLYLRSEKNLSGAGTKMQEAYDALALVQLEIEKMETDPSGVNFELLANNLETAWRHMGDAELDALSAEEETENTGEGSGTPGFELILILCTIILVLFWKQKKNRSKKQ